MADENKPAFYPRVGRNIAKNFRSAQPAPFIDDPRAMELPQYGDIDLSQPTKANLEMGRRMAERDAQLKRQQSADTSPLEKAAGALQAVRLMGSALTQSINSLPTRLVHGDKAAEKFIEERMYKPEQPLAYEYAGDVGNFLEKLETEYKIPPMLPEAVALQYLTGPATSQAMRTAGRGAEQAGRAIERRMEPVVKGALERGGLPREMVMAMGANTQSNVIKPKGGNWLRGDVEKALDPLLAQGMINNRNIPYGPEFDLAIRQRIEDLKQAASQPDYKGGAGRVAEHLEREMENPRTNEVALNKWIQSNLTNYVKKEMGTPEDPVRKLAEQGVSHLPKDLQNIEMTWTPEELAKTRKRFGFPEEETATHPTAKMWEQMADEMIAPSRATEFGEKARQQNPWLEKLNPYDTVYETMRGMPQALKFDHIVDVLRQDVASGRIRPEQLNKVSMEQAVRRTHEYDQEMAKKMRETAIKQQEGFPVHKEYPEGYKWIELAPQPEDVLRKKHEEYVRKDFPDIEKYDPYGFEEYVKDSMHSSRVIDQQQLEDALKYEGNTMGHCVGGYCPDVVAGRSRIFSLRDAKGEPHVTVEVRPKRGQSKYQTDWFSQQPEEIQNKITEQALAEHALMAGNRTPQEDRFTWGQALSNAIKNNMGEIPEEIIQIKGKGNAKPKDAYLPFVQDFVRGGNWSDVGDFKNTGLDWRTTGPQGIFMQDDVTALEQAGYKVPKYLTTAEKDDLASKLYELQTGKDYKTGLPKEPPAPDVLPDVPPDLEGMKRGGVVISNNPDTMMLELNNQKMAGGGAIAKLARAAPKSKAEIDAIARRMAPQMLGEFVRGDAGTQSVAGKTQKQFAKEKEMVHDIRPTGAERPLPKTVDVEDLKDQVMIGIAGDPTISGQTLHGLNGVPLDSPSPQHGGPLYGLGRDEEFWASGLGAANRVQNLAREAGKQYDMPVLGKYIMMGPESINYAQHVADANLSAINPAKMSKAQIESFNNLVREGYPYKKNGESFQRVFPAFPGIESPSEAYLHFSIDPELRKHFNALMQMPTVTEKHGLPSGIDVRHAITEPDLRDLETGVTGKSIGRMRPEVTKLGLSEHPTYSHDIPGEFMGSSKYPIPYELSFPDTVRAIRENPKQAPHEFGSLKMVGPRQIIDQQMIDEIKQYEEQIKKLTGKKEGGAVDKPAGGAKQPAAYSKPSAINYTFPGYGATSATQPGRSPFGQVVPCRIQYDYFLLGTTDYPTIDKIPILQEQVYRLDLIGNDSVYTLLLYNTGIPLIAPSIPTVTQYLAMIAGGKEIIAQPSQITSWLGNFVERPTPYIKAR